MAEVARGTVAVGIAAMLGVRIAEEKSLVGLLELADNLRVVLWGRAWMRAGDAE
jgi:hypothetical protein